MKVLVAAVLDELTHLAWVAKQVRFRVEGLGFRVKVLGFRVIGL